MARRPIQDVLTLPAEGRREVRAACDPSRPLIPEEQTQLHEDLSIVQGGDRILQVGNRIRDAWAESYVTELVTGHAGCGKSTELLRLASELRKPKEGRAYHVVYVDAYDYLNPFEVRLPQLVVSLMAALSEEPRVDLQRTRSGPKLWTQIRGRPISTAGECTRRASPRRRVRWSGRCGGSSPRWRIPRSSRR